MRRGLLCRDRLRGVRFDIDDCEMLAGRMRKADATQEQEQEARKYLSNYKWPGGQTGHCELDFQELFAVGIAGLRSCIAEVAPPSLLGGGLECVSRPRHPQEDLGAPPDMATNNVAMPPKAVTYRTFLLALDGLEAMILQAAQTAEDAQAGADATRQAELAEIADSCRHIATNPPQTFRDAIQLIWLADLATMHGDMTWLVVPGHIDRTLAPFYEADLAAGRITRDRALLLIESLYLLINEAVPDGLAMSVMVGGRDAAGRDLTNDLSYLCLEAIRRTKLIYPTVGICWHEGTPQGLVELAVELVAKGYPTPAFFNDGTIQKGMRALGVPAGQACGYINSTCVEITPVGASNVWVASPYLNLCQFLLDEIAEQCGDPVNAKTSSGQPNCADQQADCQVGLPVSASSVQQFEAFINSYYRRLTREIAKEVAIQENCRRNERAPHGGKPLQSVFTRDCIARGRDIDRGGAIYNWVECSFVGMANLADSLQVIREEVFAKGTITLAELKAAMAANFAGMEPLRLRLLNGQPKYGNGCAEVDALVARTAAFCQARCATHKIWPDDSPFVPGAFCWIMHEVLGRQTGATPDGRKAGFPFADGGGPAQGRERLGPTAAILSATSWDHSPMIGGLAYNMKFNSSLLEGDAARDRLRDLVITYLRRGGFETQINVVDRSTLLAAREHPEQYRDLAVRIGGYVDYFTRLSPEMQEEILMRTEFEEL